MSLHQIFYRVTSWLLRLRGIKSHFVTSEVGQQHYYEVSGFGTLPPIVLVHGIGADASHFADLALALRPHFRSIIFPDLPGHGLSEARGIKGHEGIFRVGMETLARIVQEPVFLFGNSMGGAFALNLSNQHPELVRALMLCSPGGAMMTADEIAEFRSRFVVRNLRQAYDFLARVLFRPPGLRGWLLAPIIVRLFSGRTVADILAGITPETGVKPEQITPLRVPMLFIWGQAERLLPDAHRRYFEQHLPAHTEVHRPENFAHCPQIESPRQLAQYILGFVQRSSGSAGGVHS